MKAAFLALLATGICCGVLATVSFAEGPTKAEAEKLQPQEVRNAVRLVLKRQSAAKTPDEQAAAVRDLSTLYLALARDTEMARAERLKLKAKMYSRLIAIKDDLKHDLERRKDAGDYPIAVAEPAAAEEAQTTEAAANADSQADSQANADNSKIADARGGGAVRDYGETLVELIQHTISPEHWDVNGGPGSIVYWPNLQVLVVRASGDAHGHVGGLFDGLRAAR